MGVFKSTSLSSKAKKTEEGIRVGEKQNFFILESKESEFQNAGGAG